MSEGKAVLSIGKILSDRRKKLDIDLDDVATILHIKSSYLIAFEQDDYDSLPEYIYCVGFLRSYANYLNIDAKNLLDTFKTISNKSKDVDYSAIEANSNVSNIESNTNYEIDQYSVKTNYYDVIKKPKFYIVFLSILLVSLIYFVDYLNNKYLDNKEEINKFRDNIFVKKDIDLTNPDQEIFNGIIIYAVKKSWIEVKVNGLILISRIFSSGESYRITTIDSNMILNIGKANNVLFNIFGSWKRYPSGGAKNNVKVNKLVDNKYLVNINEQQINELLK